jgi:hypothetical protein
VKAINKIGGMIYKADAFSAGLRSLGYTIVEHIQYPEPCDVLVLWNRTARDEELARKFEAAGATVLVAENGYLGKSYAGHRWFAISKSRHNGAGITPQLGAIRMAKYCEGLADWRDYGTEFVALPQRGIGESGVAMPRGYAFPSMCRTRRHPGINPCVPLEQDLAKASAVVTWGSGAAIKALIKQESDYSGLADQYNEVLRDIEALAEGRDAGQAQHVSDALAATFNGSEFPEGF